MGSDGMSRKPSSQRSFWLLYQPVKQLVVRKFDLSRVIATSIDTEKIKVRFSLSDVGNFLFNHGLSLTFVVKIYSLWRN
ncbi:hypothetical protein EAVG_03983 [Escherichia coli H420]|nr:hypothetical protein EAVG_03983 [Escherichia coli H420]SJK91288.1 conserved hypothetical protein [Escherichia coli]